MNAFAPRRTALAPTCPCGKSNKDGKFSPFKDDPRYGKCHSCGQLFTPPKGERQPIAPIRPDEPAFEPLAYVPGNIMQATWKQYGENDFIHFLNAQFGKDATDEVIDRYKIGTAKGGRTVFWHIDQDLHIRTGKIMKFDPSTGKRDKMVNDWVHTAMKLPGRYSACLWGLHLLDEYPETAPVVLVESSKNAIVGYIHYPDFCWLGMDGASGLTNAKAEPLRGRNVILLPDADEAGEKSAERSAEILRMYGCKVEVCDLLPDLDDGTDIADLLTVPGGHRCPHWDILINAHGYPAEWDADL